jgi:hypothetical protein
MLLELFHRPCSASSGVAIYRRLAAGCQCPRTRDAKKQRERGVLWYGTTMTLLPPNKVERAQRLNLFYSRRLGWPLMPAFRDVQSAAFVYHIARIQRDAGDLHIDGILGPKTYAYLRGQTWTPPTAKHLIINGEPVDVPFSVVTYEQPEGLSFYGQPCWEPRPDVTGAGVNLFVLHWDECVSSHDCFHTLLERRLSAHLLMDHDGTVYQTLDLAEARAWHARKENDRAIGIEIQNPVNPALQLPWQARRPLVAEVRPHTGEEWLHLDFTAAQKETLTTLVPVVCELMHIPRRLPEVNGEVPTAQIAPGFTGVCGHYHLQTDKLDPGLSLWPLLQKALQPSPPAVAPADVPPPPAANLGVEHA